MSLNHQAGPVAPPVASCPPGALVQELHSVLQGGLELTLPLVLDPGLPLAADQPPSHKVIVVGVENVVAPLLTLETIKELSALQDFRPVSPRASGHARCASIHVVGSGNLEVAALDIGSSQPVENPCLQIGVPFPAHTLARAHTANLGILERCQEPGHQRVGPLDVVVCHDSNTGPDVWQRRADLQTLVCNLREQNPDSWVVERICQLFQGIMLGGGCDEDELVRPAGQDALERGAELLHTVVNCRDHHCHIIRCETRLLRDRF